MIFHESSFSASSPTFLFNQLWVKGISNLFTFVILLEKKIIFSTVELFRTYLSIQAMFQFYLKIFTRLCDQSILGMTETHRKFFEKQDMQILFLDKVDCIFHSRNRSLAHSPHAIKIFPLKASPTNSMK